jgi:DNA-binding beta-propeller fold protein YncE
LILVVLAFSASAAVAIILVLTLLNRSRASVPPALPPSPPGKPDTRSDPAPPKTGGFANEIMSFGGEGIGPGLFKDARSIAVDADGHIYVGEYSGGRIQVFDSQGKFITQWTGDGKWPLRGMATDRKGKVHLVQHGTISRYEGATGTKLDDLDFPDGTGFDDVAVTADGGMVAFWYRNSDDIVRFDAAGRTYGRIRKAISGQTDSSELDIRVAVNGLGEIFALGTFNNGVFKFNRDGKFVTRFGSDGDEPGQFRAPSSIAVDNQGRVFVTDFKGVQAFDSDGRYLGVIKVQGAASGLAFNDRNELFVVARTRVYKFALRGQ